jgi:hypothetical protein
MAGLADRNPAGELRARKLRLQAQQNIAARELGLPAPNSSRTMRFTRLRSAARGANFLPTTMPSRACAWPLARTYSTKCVVRRRGRKAKTDENSSVFVSLAALGKAWFDTLGKASGKLGFDGQCSRPS